MTLRYSGAARGAVKTVVAFEINDAWAVVLFIGVKVGRLHVVVVIVLMLLLLAAVPSDKSCKSMVMMRGICRMMVAMAVAIFLCSSSRRRM